MLEVNLEIDDEITTFTLPQSWDEVSIGEFCKIFSFHREGMNVLEVVIETLVILSGIDREKIMMLPYTDFTTLTQALDFINVEMEPQNVESVMIGDEEYFIKKDFTQFTMGEIISIETLLAQGDNNLFRVMDKLLCIFLRKKKENGNLETFKGTFMDRAELFNKAPVSKVFMVFNFFLSGGNISSSNTNLFFQNPPKTKKRKKTALI